MNLTSSERVVVLSEEEGGAGTDREDEPARGSAWQRAEMSTIRDEDAMDSVPAVLQVSVPRQELVQGAQGSYVVYHISTLTPASTAAVAHRYNDFIDFHAKLVDLTGLPLPPRMLTVINRGYSFHEQRRVQLQSWLHTIVTDPACRCDELFSFLNVNAADLEVDAAYQQQAFAPSPYVVEILGWERVAEENADSAHTVYLLRLTAVHLGETWVVRRRFRDFARLHRALLDQNQRALVSLVPPLPTRMFRTRGSDDRAKKLAAFLRPIADRYETFRCPALDAFLDVNRQAMPKLM